MTKRVRKNSVSMNEKVPSFLRWRVNAPAKYRNRKKACNPFVIALVKVALIMMCFPLGIIVEL